MVFLCGFLRVEAEVEEVAEALAAAAEVGAGPRTAGETVMDSAGLMPKEEAGATQGATSAAVDAAVGMPRGASTSATGQDVGAGGSDGSATSQRSPDEGSRIGGDLAEGRSEADRDGHQPPGEGPSWRANEERLDATPGAVHTLGDTSNGVNTHEQNAWVTGNQHPTPRGSDARGVDAQRNEHPADNGPGGTHPPNGITPPLDDGSPFLQPVAAIPPHPNTHQTREGSHCHHYNQDQDHIRTNEYTRDRPRRDDATNLVEKTQNPQQKLQH
ncbi:hypothetical protein C8R44DRAFT_885518 [Mycena epipterygia]|nr:hypothetical protein C8R44DRAFT_885518 [Mycena epipterygia]